MTTATIAILVSVFMASIWAGAMTWLLSQGVSKSLENAKSAINFESDPTVLAPVYRAPSCRVATLRAINHLMDLNTDTTNDIEDSNLDAVQTVAATVATVAAHG